MKANVLVSLLVGVAAAATALAAEKRAFEIADYYRTAFVSAPEISPDGLRIAVAVTRYELEKGESWSEIWMMGAHGSNPRQMTQGRHHDSNPAFSPDGSLLAFESDRAGAVTQLFVLPVDGGEPRQLTGYPMGASKAVWSPDGRFLAVTSHVYPECGADADCNGSIRKSVEQGPLAAYMSDELLYRHWDSWRVTPAGDAVISTRSLVGAPSEVFRVAIDGGSSEQISAFNDALVAEVDIRPAQELWVQGAGDYKVLPAQSGL